MEAKDIKTVTIKNIDAKAWDEIQVMRIRKHVSTAYVIEALLEHYKKTVKEE